MNQRFSLLLPLALSVGCASSDSQPPPATSAVMPAEGADDDEMPGDEMPGDEPTEPVVIDGPLFEPGSAPRLMIVGDSIAAGPGCFKGELLDALTEGGYSDFQFVGEYTDDCGNGVMHSAMSCSTAEQHTQAMFTMPNCRQGESFPGLAPLMTSHEPDLVMLQLGVNDVWNARAISAILADYSELVSQARAQNPAVVMLVAQIHKVQPNCDDTAVYDRAQELVEAVPAWAEGESTAESPVLVADLWTNSDFNEASDCVHPNAVGAERMGQNWYEALSPLLPQ